MKRREAIRHVAFAAAVACYSSAWAQPTLTTLASFDSSNANPVGGLIADTGGNLYGTTTGGFGHGGTVYELTAVTNKLTNLVGFNGANGAGPYGSLIADSAGNFYGTTSGGTGNNGTVFEMAAATHRLTTLATFVGTTNGVVPQAGLVADGAGNLYGTTIGGGTKGAGTVLEVAAGTHALSTVASFTTIGASQAESDLLIDAAGNLYGTTEYGGTGGWGTVFEVAAGTRALSELTSFNFTNGANPIAGLISDAEGNLYGTTTFGGTDNAGTVFEYSPSTNTMKTLAMLGGTNGASPQGSLILDAAGDLFGADSYGGVNDPGTLFEIASGTDALTTLATFNTPNGTSPVGGLIADAEGNLYRSTLYGGTNNDGTVFELSDSGFVVPEPTSASILGLTGLALLARRRPRRISS